MNRTWIREGLRHVREREDALKRDHGRLHHWQALIDARGPDLMRQLVDEIGAAIEDFRELTGQAHEIRMQTLPRGGFLVSRTAGHSVTLQCRPDYAGHTVCCNLARTVDGQSTLVELPFNLHFTVDDHDRVGLRHGAQRFADVPRVAEFLLTPVLFPSASPPVQGTPRPAA